MRNLKRALSLALASVMLLGMMVVGTSAASYTDVDDNDNVEAIEVLNAVNVMIGRQGNFEPDEPVNRHEMAVIMAKLVLGNETADNYVGTHPFTDVFPWADKYVAACYENGLVSGTSATTYGGNQPLTAVQAAAMMLRALGYEDLSKGATDWRAPVTAAANRIRLFDGVASNPSERLNRNQVAQLALNTLKSPVVDTKQGLNITGSNGDYTFTVNGDREYIARSSREAYARAINSTESQGTSASSIGGYTIELGEHLYNGDLKLYDDRTDVFGRPSRRWEYDGKEIGTYAKDELLRAEYTSEVTGRELYDLLGSSVVRDFAINVTIDGVSDPAIDGSLFNETAINRNNRAGVGGTGNGVLTQVYVDPNKGADGTVDIAIINTYLAFAAKDYDAKKETLDLEVYGLDKKTGGDLVKTITANEDVETLKVSSEDFAVEDVKEDDPFLVTVADGAIQTMKSVEPMSAVEITSFQARTDTGMGSGNLTTGGKKYSFSSAAEWDNPCLKAYTDGGDNVNLKDTAYDVYLDNYDNVIGVKEVSKTTNYVFITGVNSGDNNLSNITVKAGAIFMDGTMEVIEIDRGESELTLGTDNENSVINKWCTYTKNNKGIYTVDEVEESAGAGKKGQSHVTWDDSASVSRTIDNKHIYMSTVTEKLNATATSNPLAYGKDNSVYIAAEIDRIITSGSTTDIVISGVSSVTTGIENVDIKALTEAEAKAAAPTPADNGTIALDNTSHGVFTLYDKDGWVIAMVIVGEDNGSNSAFAYVHNSSVAQEYYMGSDGYKWERTVIIDGVEATLTEVNDTRISLLEKMDANKWYRVRTNSDGNVTAILGSPNADGTLDGDTDVGGKFGDWNLDWDTVPTAYNVQYDQASKTLVDSITKAGVETVLYHEAFSDKVPSADGRTLYVEQGKNSGIRFRSDVKVVLDQMNANKRETEFYTGETGVKNALRDLHETAEDSGVYSYEISAVINGGMADVIVIKDLVADGDGGTITPPPATTSGKVGLLGGKLYVDASITDEVEQATAIEAWLLSNGYTDVDVTVTGTTINIAAKKGSITFKWDNDGSGANNIDDSKTLIDIKVAGTEMSVPSDATVSDVTGVASNAANFVMETSTSTTKAVATTATVVAGENYGKVGYVTFTAVSAITDATGTFTVTKQGEVAAADTVTIGSTVYVKIGAKVTTVLTAAKAVTNGGAGTTVTTQLKVASTGAVFTPATAYTGWDTTTAGAIESAATDAGGEAILAVGETITLTYTVAAGAAFAQHNTVTVTAFASA